MSLFHLLILAVIQGITEFLPISSSGHLALFPGLTGTVDQGLAIDVAVHVGTLFAVIAYFWVDVKRATSGIHHLATGRPGTSEAAMAKNLVLCTIPVVVAGFLLHLTGYIHALRSLEVIGWSMLIFGLVLYFADAKGPQTRNDADWTLKDAVLMGLAQAIALIPGTSRSGVTITAGRALGYDRESSAKLAMLMSIPTILASGVLLMADALSETNPTLWRDAGIAAVFAFLSALAALFLMMRLLKSVSFTPYVWYRCVLGAILLFVAYT